MSDDNTIVIDSVQETDFGEKAVVDSPFETKDYISNLPWKEYQEEVSNHGSLKEKAVANGTNVKTSQLTEVFGAMEKYRFSDDLACHQSWDPDALGGDGAWTIDKEAVEEVTDFWQFCGFNVEINTDV